MLSNITKLIEKHPKKALSIWLIIFFPLIIIILSILEPPKYQPQVQNQVLESFDRTKCKVYTIGLSDLGAMVFQFKGVDGKLDYLLFADDPSVIQAFDRTDYGIIWWSSSGFISSDYQELANILPPEGLQELNTKLRHYSYAAVATSAYAKAITESPNAGLLNTCDVE